ncbi:MAG: hypothetical protein HQK83_13070 [Fibrobacteria bacterium]|nr:hypothetical protein [Fibrobacteria bacterium]
MAVLTASKEKKFTTCWKAKRMSEPRLAQKFKLTLAEVKQLKQAILNGETVKVEDVKPAPQPAAPYRATEPSTIYKLKRFALDLDNELRTLERTIARLA